MLNTPFAQPQSASEGEIEFTVELREYTLTVVDETGKPIVGVAAEAAGIRCQEFRGGWYGWPVVNVGENNHFTSDANGKITVSYPTKFGRPSQWMTTTTIVFRFIHHLYVANQVEVVPRAEGIEHVMNAGCKVLFSAVDDAGLRIDRFGVAMAGPGGEADWIKTTGRFRREVFPTDYGKPCSLHQDPRESTYSAGFYRPSS